jgi:hypothetical protein
MTDECKSFNTGAQHYTSAMFIEHKTDNVTSLVKAPVPHLGAQALKLELWM